MKTCRNCGAPLKSGTCEYCGTVYAEKTDLPSRPFLTKSECLAEIYKAEAELAEIDKRVSLAKFAICFVVAAFIAINVLFFVWWNDTNYEQYEITQTYEIRGADE